MLKTFEEQGIDLADTSVCENITEFHEPIHVTSCEPTSELTSEKGEATHEPPTTPAENPAYLWSLAELAQRYSCSTRNVQMMFSAVQTVQPDRILKQKQGRKCVFTADCVTLLDSLKTARERGIDTAQWVQTQTSSQGSAASPDSDGEHPSVSSFPSQLAVSSPVQVVSATNELSNLVSAEWQKRETAHQQGIQRIENQFTGRAATRDRLTEFVDAVYGDRVEEIKTKSALKDKLEQVVAADQAIEALDDDLEDLIRQVVPAKNG